ncbi:hypothetical protein LINGRAPRIM_LOCUS1426 [Linum grandiflorum]
MEKLLAAKWHPAWRLVSTTD